MSQIAINFRIIFVDNTESLLVALCHSEDGDDHVFTLEEGSEKRIAKSKIKKVISSGVAPSAL